MLEKTLVANGSFRPIADIRPAEKIDLGSFRRADLEWQNPDIRYDERCGLAPKPIEFCTFVARPSLSPRTIEDT